MQNGEVIQRVQSLYSKGLQSNDSRLTSRHIYSALLTARSILIRQQANRNQKTSQWVYQTLPCIELQAAAIHECPCVPNNSCSFLRSKHKLPKPITGLEASLIQSVTSLDGSKVFDETTFETLKYNKGNKYTFNKPLYFIRNGYLYVTVLKVLGAVTVSGLFEDFVEAAQYPSLCGDCEDCACRDIMEIEFPIDGDLIRPLIQIANDEIINLMKQIPEDRSNNNTDDTSPGRMIHQPNQQEG